VSPLSEIRLVAQRELRKNFRSVKGIILIILSLLGGTAATLAITWVERQLRKELPDMPPEAMRAAREAAITKALGDPATGKLLADTPEVLLAVFFVTILLTPMLIALLGFDSVSGDLQHKAIRYFTLRTRRVSYTVGKWAGLWVTVSTITLLMHVVIWVISIGRGEGTAAAIVSWGARLWVMTLPISAVWCAIATLVSTIFKTPILALLGTFGAFFLLWLTYTIGLRFDLDALMYAYPNSYDRFLINARVDRWVTGLAACVGMTLAYIGASTLVFAKRDV
jgi:ABC-type transport system involved in multi-copper enzyme maturation permease subunit